jgi:hypothetical protein
VSVSAPVTPQSEKEPAEDDLTFTTATALPPRQLLEYAVVGVVVIAGIACRSYSRSDLWIDETLSVNIARLPAGEMVEALRHDGHPPVYYFLLHWWMLAFGQGDGAVRAMSGVISIATLPLIWWIGNTIGGRRCALAALVLMASSPQAVRYATETRMYSLIVLLASAGWLLLRAARRRPTIPRLAGVAVVAGLLLLTHYWSGYLLTATGTLLLWSAWRKPETRRTELKCAGALVAGGIIFLPWLPNFIVQATTTGTPWASPARPAEVAVSLLVGSDSTGEARMLGVMLGVLVLLALFGRRVDDHRIEIDIRTQPQVRAEWALVTLVLSLAVVGGVIGAVAFAERYTSIILPVLIVVAAVGITRLPNRTVRIGVVSVVAVLGLAASLHTSVEDRTQVGQVARALKDQAIEGDLVVHCPDQLAPGVIRYAPEGLNHLTYPLSPWPDRIDWQYYEYRVSRVEPIPFADVAHAEAGNRPIWLVWSEGYPLLGQRCEAIFTELGALRPNHVVVTAAGDAERAWLYRFDPT